MVSEFLQQIPGQSFGEAQDATITGGVMIDLQLTTIPHPALADSIEERSIHLE